jgi:hypothetical protein
MKKLIPWLLAALILICVFGILPVLLPGGLQ